MIIKKWVEFADEIDIFLSADDISVILHESDDDTNIVMIQINSIAGFLKGIPDDTINDIGESARNTISNFLSEQAQRFRSDV